MSAIYFIEAVGTGWVKVGWAKRPSSRISDLQTGSPIPLRVIAEIPGPVSLERRAHRALGKGGSGEWFPRQEAMALLRLSRRAGLAAATDAIIRSKQSDMRSSRWANRFIEKATRRVAAQIGAHALAIASSDCQRLTGAGRKTWERAVQGHCLPAAETLFNSLHWLPASPVLKLATLIANLPLPSLDHANRIRGVRAA